MKEYTNKSGFTLIELLIVISILGILASIALVAFSSAQIRGRDAQRKSNLNEVSHSLELFYADYGKYPPSDGANASGQIYGCPYQPSAAPPTGSPCTWGTSEFKDVDGSGVTKTTYMKLLPKDPVKGQVYWYRVDATGLKFQLYAHIENTQDALITTGYTCGNAACNFGISSPNTTPTDVSW